MSILRDMFLWLNDTGYRRVMRPLLFRSSAQESHHRMMRLLARLDTMPVGLGLVNRLSFTSCPVEVGGVKLSHPLMLAAGFVKGDGFANEAEALEAVRAGRNVMPGWRAMPRLVGAVEFGSFTRWPRVGNPGTVMWRDVPTQSTQNRVGLKNPGALAAAEFLAQRRNMLPPIFGINIAVSPGVTDPAQERAEAQEALGAFLDKDVLPNWFTLNLSCPNTEDDPGSRQTANHARDLCGALVEQLQSVKVPLWVKISPDLAPAQYDALLSAFAETGVRAVVATNTLGQPTPEDTKVIAGVGGGKLREQALQTVDYLAARRAQLVPQVDIIACGGVMDGTSWRSYAQLGVKAAQYWSALVYRGPLAGALIEQEGKR